jgi:hypothetical protein
MHTARSLQLLVSLKLFGTEYQTGNSMELCPNWAVTSTQEIPNVLWNHKAYYRARYPEPINIPHTTPTHYIWIYFNIILLPTSRFSQCWLTFCLPYQNYIHIAFLLTLSLWSAHHIILDLILLIIFGKNTRNWLQSKFPISTLNVNRDYETELWRYLILNSSSFHSKIQGFWQSIASEI